MEDTGSTSLPKKKEKKYVQGPKLKILPSQLERPAEPPVLLDLLDTFSRMKKGGDAVDEMTEEKILKNASAADRRSLLPVVANRSGTHHLGSNSMESDEDDDGSISMDLSTMGEPRHMPPSDDDEGEEVDERVKIDKDAWRHANDPWNAHEVAGFNKKTKKWGVRTPLSKLTHPAPKKGGGAGGHRQLQQQQVSGGDGGERRQGSKGPKRSKTAMGMQGESGRVETDLNKVLLMAENMLIGNTPSNRLESTLYGGSDDLSVPKITISKDDVLEITHERGGQTRRMKWNEHAEARVCGVLAMKELLQRHQMMKKRKEEVEGQVESMKKEVQKAGEHVDAMREKKKAAAAEVQELQAKLRKAESQLEREKTARQREVLKLSDLIKELRGAAEGLHEDRETLTLQLRASEENAKKQTDIVATLRKELSDRQLKERDDAAKFVNQINMATKDTVEKERLEHEVEMLNDDFEYCKKKLKSCADHVVRTDQENDERMRRISSEQNYKIAQMSGELEAQAAAKEVADEEVARLKQENDELMASVMELQEALESSKLEHTQLQEVSQVAVSDNDMLRRKVQWTWLMTLVLVKNAFPPNADAECQSSSSPHMVNAGTMTHGAVAESGGASVAEDFWVIVRRMSRRLDLKGKDETERMSIDDVLTFIEKCYKQKAVADMCDDREFKQRQSFKDFLHLLCIEETQEVNSALKRMAKIVANLELICSLSSQGPGTRKAGSSTTKAGFKASQELYIDADKLMEVFPRIVLFSRFLGLDTGGYQDSIPREGLDTYLAMLVRIRRGQLPMLPAGNEPAVVVMLAEVTDAMEFVFARLDKHTRIEMKMKLQSAFPTKGGQVDLDSVLAWLMGTFKEMVYDKTEDSLRALFATYDDNDNADLEFYEFVNMTHKLKMDRRNALSMRMMLKMYARMLLSPRVDSGVFVTVAKEFGLCEFRPMPFNDEMRSHSLKLGHLVDESRDQWTQIESTVLAARKFKQNSSIGLRMEEHEAVLTEIMQTGLFPEMTKLLLSFLAEDAGINQLPEPLDVATGRRRSTIDPNAVVRRTSSVAGRHTPIRTISAATGAIASEEGNRSIRKGVQRGGSKEKSVKKSSDQSLKNQA